MYCLYFGLTDKDTGKQELTMDEAKDIAIPLFIEAGSGYTVYEAEGGFAKEDGTVVQNDTLVFDSTHGDEQAILDLIEKVRRALNVESVYAAASYRASRKRRIERCERRLLLRAAFAQKPSFVRCLKTALYDECC